MHTHVHTQEIKQVKCWIYPSRVSKSSCVTQLTLPIRFCLDVPGKISSFYACRDEWASAVNPSCKPHQRMRGQRNRRGLSNRGIITLSATLSGSGDCWGRPVPAVGWVSSRADKKKTPHLGKSIMIIPAERVRAPSDFWVDFECSFWMDFELFLIIKLPYCSEMKWFSTTLR